MLYQVLLLKERIALRLPRRRRLKESEARRAEVRFAA
jgi:hypothetical protein